MDRRTLLLAALAAIPVVAAGAGDAPLDRATLRGLKGVSVVIDPLDPQLERNAVRQDELRSRIEQKLERAGIPIDDNAAEFLGLRLLAVRSGRGPYGLSVSLGLYQPVQLTRDRNIKTATQTWEVETVLLTDPKLLNQALTETLDELADRFVTAWRAANPK